MRPLSMVPRLATVLILGALAPPALAVNDVMLQVVDGKIAVGVIDDATFTGSLGTRVFGGAYLSNFRSSNPGFFSLPYGHPAMPAGAESFPSLHDVGFDLLPMVVGPTGANLLYWDGADLGGDGLTPADVAFVPSTGVEWQVLDANLAPTMVKGTDELVPGGLIQRTSSDLDPFDGVDSGSIHKHLPLLLNVLDGNPSPTPPAGMYMIEWVARSEGFQTSDPFLFVHRTSMVAAGVLNLAIQWAETNYDSLVAAGLEGDYDDNGLVDGSDFLTWQRALGWPADPLGSGADGNRSGTVDGPDLSVWRDRVAASSIVGPYAAVAEPETSAVVVVSALVMAFVSQWQARRRLSP
jgi:hypothetical protein